MEQISFEDSMRIIMKKKEEQEKINIENLKNTKNDNIIVEYFNSVDSFIELNMLLQEGKFEIIGE